MSENKYDLYELQFVIPEEIITEYEFQVTIFGSLNKKDFLNFIQESLANYKQQLQDVILEELVEHIEYFDIEEELDINSEDDNGLFKELIKLKRKLKDLIKEYSLD